jgi:hypothetical protein
VGARYREKRVCGEKEGMLEEGKEERGCGVKPI